MELMKVDEKKAKKILDNIKKMCAENSLHVQITEKRRPSLEWVEMLISIKVDPKNKK